ncbi:MAG: 50S ribosomal protein L24 [Deltaproteobacteria bacterium]|jgi:large subunit ribosomal protein L24|nr:50S ribosomal protein L24 [Deltaproteobacteria bacterium]
MAQTQKANKDSRPKARRPEFRKGDTLHVISGPAKGKAGKLREYRPKTHSVVVEGVNMGMKHFKPRPDQNQVGERKMTERPIHVSNVMLLCPNCHRPTRISHRVANVTRSDRMRNVSIRVCKHCGKDMDDRKS